MDRGMNCVALCVERYLSNAASFILYGIICLTRLVESATLFTTFEEHMCYTRSVRQPPE